MMTECTDLLVLTISAFWSSSRSPLATKMSSRRQRSIPLGGRYIQVSLYIDLLRSHIRQNKTKTYKVAEIYGIKNVTHFQAQVSFWQNNNTSNIPVPTEW